MKKLKDWVIELFQSERVLREVENMKKWIIAITILIMTSLMTFANSSAPYMLPNQTAIYFDEMTGIELVDETIVIKVNPDLETVEYIVHYQFRNILNEKIERPIWFLSNDLKEDSFDIEIDGQKIETSLKEIDEKKIMNWSIDVKPKFIDPIDQKIIESNNTYWHHYGSISVEEFMLTIEPMSQVDVVVHYTSNNGYIRKDEYFSNLKTQIYYLSPASFYEGEARVDIEIILPENVLIGSNIELNKTKDNLYTIMDFPIQDDNLYLTFLDKKDLFFGTNHRNTYYKYLALFIAFLIIQLIKFRNNKRVKRGLIAGIVISLLSVLARPTYGTLFLMMLSLPFILIILMIIGIRVYIKSKRRNKI